MVEVDEDRNPSKDSMLVSSLGSFYMVVTPHTGDACGKADRTVMVLI